MPPSRSLHPPRWPRVTAEPGPGREARTGVLAAVDLGSNSFHMVVARRAHGQLTVIDRLREMVRLAAGLDEHKRLAAASQARALECLGRFGQRIRDMHAEQVRVVGTNTLRQARGAEAFLRAAEERLGHPVELISGIEEARLIYLGAVHGLPAVDGAQLCVDIGGGSTELARGRGLEPELLESLYLGCVSLSQRFFADGRLDRQRFADARLAARMELEPLRRRFLTLPIARFIGTSGTIRAAARVIRGLRGEQARLDRAGVELLIETMLAAGHAERLQLPGLSEQRRPVFPGGIAILAEVLLALDAEQMLVADGALREGILYDLLGRLGDEDARQRSVRALAARMRVDEAQAARVASTALALLDDVAESWKLQDPELRVLLGWAARLHEIGLDIAHAHYHRHGAYLLEHADLPGFTRQEQQLLAMLVGSHRRSFRRKAFAGARGQRRRQAMRLAVILRLAVLLNRSRAGDEPPPVRLEAHERSLRLLVPAGWPDANPLTVADLAKEAGWLADGAGLTLAIEVSG